MRSPGRGRRCPDPGRLRRSWGSAPDSGPPPRRPTMRVRRRLPLRSGGRRLPRRRARQGCELRSRRRHRRERFRDCERWGERGCRLGDRHPGGRRRRGWGGGRSRHGGAQPCRGVRGRARRGNPAGGPLHQGGEVGVARTDGPGRDHAGEERAQGRGTRGRIGARGSGLGGRTGAGLGRGRGCGALALLEEPEHGIEAGTGILRGRVAGIAGAVEARPRARQHRVEGSHGSVLSIIRSTCASASRARAIDAASGIWRLPSAGAASAVGSGAPPRVPAVRRRGSGGRWRGRPRGGHGRARRARPGRRRAGPRARPRSARRPRSGRRRGRAGPGRRPRCRARRG